MAKKIIVITGQTATGKTSLALEKALSNKGNLINADSRQIYRGLTIISGKDTEDNHFHNTYTIGNFSVGYYTIKNIPVWLYDIVNVQESFSSHEYSTVAVRLIAKLLDKNITPVIVGGTYLYLHHLLYGIDQSVAGNTDLRKKLQNKTVYELQQLILEQGREVFVNLNKSDQNNPHRLIRKLEQLDAGIKWTGMKQDYKYKLPILLNLPDLEINMYGTYIDDKTVLRERIHQRVVQRLNNGATEEVQKFLEAGCIGNEPGLKTLGVSMLYDYIHHKISKSDLINQWVTKELQYAKRQYTFMKRDPNIKWIDPA